MRTRWTTMLLAAMLVAIAVAGCSRQAAIKAPEVVGAGGQEVVGAKASAPAPILRTIMWSTLFCDLDDPEWKLKMKALHDMNIRGASGLLMICRPRFCEYPWVTVSGQQGSSDATYDLSRMNPRWLAHLNDVVDYANTFEPPFALQFDYLPHPTLRHGEGMVFRAARMLFAPLSLMDPPAPVVEPRDEMVFTAKGNLQGIKANGTRLFNDTPTGAWAAVSRNWLAQTVPIINRARFGAVLFILEGAGSRACEQWYWNEARAAGLSPSIHIITNEDMPGAVRSPHLHSVSAYRKYSGPYPSSDGWEPNAREWRQCIDAQAKTGRCAAIELYRTEFSDGSGGGAYGKRTRPSAAYIARKCGGVLVEAGR